MNNLHRIVPAFLFDEPANILDAIAKQKRQVEIVGADERLSKGVQETIRSLQMEGVVTIADILDSVWSSKRQGQDNRSLADACGWIVLEAYESWDRKHSDDGKTGVQREMQMARFINPKLERLRKEIMKAQD